MGKRELVDLTMFCFAQTKRAALLGDTEDEKGAQWIPLSQIEMAPTSRPRIFEVTMPEWLAEARGFI